MIPARKGPGYMILARQFYFQKWAKTMIPEEPSDPVDSSGSSIVSYTLKSRLDSLIDEISLKFQTLDAMEAEHEETARDYRKAVEFEMMTKPTQLDISFCVGIPIFTQLKD